MAKTTDRQIVNGQEYLIKDSQARADNADMKKTQDQNVTGLKDKGILVKIKNHLDYLKLTETGYYSTSGDSLIIESLNAGEATAIPLPYKGTYTISVENAARVQVLEGNTIIYDVYTYTAVVSINNPAAVKMKLISNHGYPWNCGTVQIEYGSSATAFVPFGSPVFESQVSDISSAEIHTAHQLNLLSDKKSNEGTVADGLCRYDGKIQSGIGKYSRLSISGGDLLYFEGYCYNDAFPVVNFFKGDTLVSRLFQTEGTHYGNIIAPANADNVIVNATASPVIAIVPDNGNYERKTVNQFIDESAAAQNLKGKKIVWFGTSIPAGGYIGANVTRNYPSFIANRYNCTVYNEAVGSSPAHCKELGLISEANPYGFNTDFNLSSRCLSNTTEEMEWIIDHFGDSFWTNKPASLPEQTQQEILSFSYETKLDKYLTEQTFPDLFVFDHGYNDYVSGDDYYTGHEYEPYTLQGALNFLIRRIYSYKPEAKIIIIGNYKYQTRNGLVVQAQEAVARRWDIPIYDTWKHTGLSDEQVYCDFQWINSGGTWSKQSAETHLETLSNVLLPDGVHPHSRPDNLIINRMANAIGEWLSENATSDN